MPPDKYKRELLREREAIPRVLKLFREQGIHATWATVGLLFLRHREELTPYLPSRLPDYTDPARSPYPALLSQMVGEDEAQDPSHYASSLIRMIAETPYQRIGTHTFSHYYCKEAGQAAADFAADLQAAVRVAERDGVALESLVFPRNQLREDYLGELRKAGIRSFRGNPDHPLYREGYSPHDRLPKRLLRLLDAYLNLSGYHTYVPGNEFLNPKDCGREGDRLPLNLPASQFLRSYDRSLRLLEPLRLQRIRKAMTYAAKHRRIYHLWWHPYNLADREGRSFKLLERIVAHYKHLEQTYGMRSAGMEELCDWIMGQEEESK
ncbi:polysaccharide deacetylase family protein [Paenibacillus yonginensis]|nr:polysaccharide deacetylase family protein [Paenibacillus yonginensis]